jgi:hypothetical protein
MEMMRAKGDVEGRGCGVGHAVGEMLSFVSASSTTMEEMTMQLSVVPNDIQDVLEAVRNPPGKRKRWGSNQNTEPTMPTNR